MNPAPEPKRVLILDHHGIGDVITSTGLVLSVRERYPDAHVTLFVRNPPVADFFAPGVVDRVVGKPKGLAGVAATLATLCRHRVDLLICTTELSHTRFVAAVALLSRARRVVAETSFRLRTRAATLVPLNYGLSKFESNMQILEAAGVPAARDRPHVHVPEAARAEAARRVEGWRERGFPEGPLIGVGPGCLPADDFKRWPASRFRDLIARLIDEGRGAVVLFGGPTDLSYCGEILEGLDPAQRLACVSTAGELTLGGSAALLSLMDLFIANDSGLSHMAGALGVPTVTLMGPTSPHRCAPYRSGLVVWGKPNCAPCYPGLLHGCGNPVCVTNLDPEAAYRAASDLLTAPAEVGVRIV